MTLIVRDTKEGVQTGSASPRASRARASIAMRGQDRAGDRAHPRSPPECGSGITPRRAISPGRNVFCCKAETTDFGLDRGTAHPGPVITGENRS